MPGYNLSGPKWANNSISWSFANTIPGVGNTPPSITKIGAVYQDTIRQALQRWSSVSGITFHQVEDGPGYAHPANIRIGFATLGTPSNGIIGLTGTGTIRGVYPLTFKNDAVVKMEDPSETSLVLQAGGYVYQRYNVTLFQIVLHEIGHALGIDHSPDPTSIMSSSATSAGRDLNADDIAGIQALYGAPAAVILPPPPRPPPVILLPPRDELVLHMSEDAYQGDAQFVVTIDGKQVGGTQTTTASRVAGQVQDFIIKGDFGSSKHAVGVTFLNDAWGGSRTLDRNLFVKGMHYKGVAVANTEVAIERNGTTTLSTSGSADTITFKMSADTYLGGAQAIVRVDGQQLGGIHTISASHALGMSDTLSFASSASIGSRAVSVQFLNDAWGGSTATDRNLYVDSIDVGSRHYAVATPMQKNGTNTFAIHDPAPPPPPAFTISNNAPHPMLLPV